MDRRQALQWVVAAAGYIGSRGSGAFAAGATGARGYGTESRSHQGLSTRGSLAAGRNDLNYVGNVPLAAFEGPPLEVLKAAGLA
jgi:hypothetical protein